VLLLLAPAVCWLRQMCTGDHALTRTAWQEDAARRGRAVPPLTLRAQCRDDADAAISQVRTAAQSLPGEDSSTELCVMPEYPGMILLLGGLTPEQVVDGQVEPEWMFAGPGLEGLSYEEAVAMAEDAERLFSEMLGGSPQQTANTRLPAMAPVPARTRPRTSDNRAPPSSSPGGGARDARGNGGIPRRQNNNQTLGTAPQDREGGRWGERGEGKGVGRGEGSGGRRTGGGGGGRRGGGRKEAHRRNHFQRPLRQP
jgi:hypothetical protein